MAFFCPAGFPSHRRRRRGLNDVPINKEKSSTQDETEFEPTKMVVVRDFVPCVDDELEVKRGQQVKALYQENEWRYVVAEDGKEGFIPYTYCIPITEQTGKAVLKHELPYSSPSLARHELTKNAPNNTSRSFLEANNNTIVDSADSLGSLQEFVKRHHGRYVVLFDYSAVQEDDISTRRGEHVTVLNKDDVDWYWVKTDDGREGFIPREYLQPVQATVNSGSNQLNHLSSIDDSRLSLPTFLGDGHKMELGVKQLKAIRDFSSREKYELTVEEGEQLFTDDSDLDKLSWIWVYSPQSRRRGFVPRTHLRWAQNTTFL